MSGDSKIGLQVGGIVRTGPPRKVASGTSAPTNAPVAARAANDAMPNARLIGIANGLAEQAAPVDASRTAALRSAISSGSYAVDPAAIAKAMVGFYKGGAD